MKITKNIRLSLCALLLSVCACSSLKSQETSNTFSETRSLLPLAIVLPEGDSTIPREARMFLKNKLTQVATKNGIAAGENFSRFFITATVAVEGKDIVPGPPPQISQNLDLTIYIVDYFDRKIFSSISIPLKGIGTNETKAYINAFKNLNPNVRELGTSISFGKQKIIDYYEAQCGNIIKQANSLAGQKQYENAIYLLTSIPELCSCYDKALQATASIYQQYIDHLCDVNLSKAKAAWAAEQNSNGAREAGQYLSQIYPDAKCYGEAENLYREIKGKVLDDWKFVMKIYQDQVDLESQRIKAWRDVGVAYGNGQQPTTYVLGWLQGR